MRLIPCSHVSHTKREAFEFPAQAHIQITGQKTKKFFDSSKGSAVPILQGLERKNPLRLVRLFICSPKLTGQASIWNKNIQMKSLIVVYHGKTLNTSLFCDFFFSKNMPVNGAITFLFPNTALHHRSRGKQFSLKVAECLLLRRKV